MGNKNSTIISEKPMNYLNLSKQQLKSEYDSLNKRYELLKAQGLCLDLSRGKPSPAQLDLSNGLLDSVNSSSVIYTENGTDCRNYGVIEGIPEARRLFAEILDTDETNVMVASNSSLTLMFALFSHAMIDGIMGNTPWCKEEKLKFLCPAPGYDRHFCMAEHFGFELVTVDMKDDGPDMAQIGELVKDPAVKGVWCVPKYQNPTGTVFGDQTVRRFAALKPAAPDFRIFWDNAYCVHNFEGETAEIPDIISECKKAGNEDMVYEFCSTSKMSFPGGGIAAIATSPANLIDIKNFLQYATIGPDKLNQLRAVRFFKNKQNLKKHMQAQAKVLSPKFAAAQKILDSELSGCGIAKWTKPKGGYFISFDTPQGCAKRTVELCARCGVKFTPAGSTFPYGDDKNDRNIRLAPSFASLDDIEKAVEIFCVAVKLAALEKMLND